MKVNFAKPSAGSPATAPAAPVNAAPVIDVAATVSPAAPTPIPEAIVEAVPTPVAGVTVETVTTIAPPAPAIAATVTGNDGSAVAVRPTQAVAESAPAFYNDDSIDSGDLVLPRLNIVQKVGDLSNVFPGGTILLNGELTLVKAPEKFLVSDAIRVLIIGFQPTLFVEKVEGGARGNMFKTEQEVVNAKGTTDWNVAQATGAPLYQRLATAMILIQQPVDANGVGLDDASFPTEIEGKKYALALYSMKGSAYTNAAKHFKSARKVGHLKSGYRSGWWTFRSQLKKFGDNYAYIPVVKADGTATAELQKGLFDVLGF